MRIEEKLKEMGLTLPPPMQAPRGMRLPFASVRVAGTTRTSLAMALWTRPARCKDWARSARK